MPPADLAEFTSRPVLASFTDYAGAQRCVDTLSDGKFPVQNVTIVGSDLRTVELVLGRLSWGRAAVSGLGTGAWFGLLIGLFISLFAAPTNSNGTGLVLLGVVWGAAFGIVFGLVSYALTRGRRDFTSRQALQAGRYEVLCDASVIGEARRILGIAAPVVAAPGPGTPVPPAPGATAPAPPAAPQAPAEPPRYGQMRPPSGE